MLKVLVVDDNKLILKIVHGYLTSRGCEVEVCDGPFGVLNKITAYRPDVLLLDMQMPGLSGSRIAVMLKQKKDMPCTPRVYSFSSEPETFQRELVRQGLVDGFFYKSEGNMDGLFELIKGACPAEV
jgi:CheY-like chemotaxis protein